VPEPAGRSFAELDLLFERGVSARKFASTKIDVFEDSVVHETVEGTGTLKNYEEKGSRPNGLAGLKGEDTMPPRQLV
jgi:MFS transporter, SP family, general alpha glucoside:H+ symporter